MSKKKDERNKLILKDRKKGFSYRKIARRFGIDVAAVFRIINR